MQHSRIAHSFRPHRGFGGLIPPATWAMRNRAILGGLVACLAAAITPLLRAAEFQWLPAPASGDWNATGNWTPAGTPNGPNDSANFTAATTSSIFLSEDTQVAKI